MKILKRLFNFSWSGAASSRFSFEPRNINLKIFNLSLLTLLTMAAMLYLLSTHLKVGIGTPFNGHNRPLLSVVFLYPSKTRALIRFVLSVMVGCIEQTFKSLADSVIGSSNLIHSTAQRLEPMAGGYSLFNGVHHVTR